MNTFRLTGMTAKLALLGLFLSGLQGCAVMSEEECYATNWYDKGYQDGTEGKGSGMLGEYVEACSKYVNVDRNSYNQGRRQGAEVFCDPSRAYNIGLQGYTLTDICRGTRYESEFVENYKAGYVVYDMGQQIEEIDRNLSDIRDLMDSGNFRGDTYDKLRSNYRYLEQLRYHAQDDYSKLSNANGRRVTVRNYRNEINRMPYPDAMRDARAMKDNIAKANREFDAIRRDMEEANRRMDRAEDDHEYNRYRKQWECLRHAEQRLKRKLDDYQHSYHPSRHPDLNSDRQSCMYR
ncbi:DUF2799 domain-containing protein [Succinimonas sp.]|uniref:DUF2799 domain-containing protein n=1 Tax=Succinimonas sp. TaxID=1936151 RepID=UPI0038689D60